MCATVAALHAYHIDQRQERSVHNQSISLTSVSHAAGYGMPLLSRSCFISPLI